MGGASASSNVAVRRRPPAAAGSVRWRLPVLGPLLVEPRVGRRQRERAHPHDAAALLAVLARGRPGHLGRGLGVDRFERRPHGVDGLAPLVDLGRVDEVGDGADADDLRGPVAEHLLGTGREEGDGSGGVDAHDGAPGGGPEQGLEAVAGVVGLAGVAAGDPRLLGQVAQVGPVPRDHGVDGRRHQGRDGGHDGHLAPLDRRVLGRADEQDGHQQGQIEAEEPDQQVQPPAVERQPHDGQEVDDHQPGMRPALGVADDGDDRDVADRDDQPGPVGQALPGQQEGGGDECEEEDAGDGDLAAGVVGERDDGDQHRADGDQREDRQADAHGAGEADG